MHLRMLDVAAQNKFKFDSCQMPLNVMDAHFRSFSNQVLPRLKREAIGALGMKSMAGGNILKSSTVTAMECLQFALNLPADVIMVGCDSMERLDQAFEAVRTFRPLSQNDLGALLAKTREAAMTGRFEPFKTTPMFDGTASHPDWMA